MSTAGRRPARSTNTTPRADRWRPLAELQTPRGALAAAVLGGRIHAVGGVGRSRNTAAHESYDPATNRWTTLAGVPTPRDHLAVVAADGRLYAIGGRIDGSYARNLAVNEAYDPAADRWEQRAPMPTARSGIAAAVLGGRILVVGGEAPVRHLRPGGRLRREKQRLEQPRPHADGAARPRRRGGRRQAVRHFGRAHAGRLGVGGE